MVAKIILNKVILIPMRNSVDVMATLKKIKLKIAMAIISSISLD